MSHPPLSSDARPETDRIYKSGDCHHASPPYGGVQIEQDRRVRGRIGQLPESCCSDDDAVDEEEDACEKPDRHLFAHVSLLPENDVKDDEGNGDDSGPDDGFLEPVVVVLFGDLRCAVDEAFEFGFGFGLGHEADDDGDDDTYEPGPEGSIHVFGHSASVCGKCDVT